MSPICLLVHIKDASCRDMRWTGRAARCATLRIALPTTLLKNHCMIEFVWRACVRLAARYVIAIDNVLVRAFWVAFACVRIILVQLLDRIEQLVLQLLADCLAAAAGEPSSSEQEACAGDMVARVLGSKTRVRMWVVTGIVHRNMMEHRLASLREVYYTARGLAQELFASQVDANLTIERMVAPAWLDASRLHMHILASSRGLLAGPISWNVRACVFWCHFFRFVHVCCSWPWPSLILFAASMRCARHFFPKAS